MKPDLEAKRLFLEAAVRLGERFKVERDMAATQRDQRCTWAVYVADERVATIREFSRALYRELYVSVGQGILRGRGSRKPVGGAVLCVGLNIDLFEAVGGTQELDEGFWGAVPDLSPFEIPPLLPVHRGRPKTVPTPSELSARWARFAVAELGGSRRAEVITGIPASTLRQATRGARGLSNTNLKRLQDELVDDDLAEFLAGQSDCPT